MVFHQNNKNLSEVTTFKSLKDKISKRKSINYIIMKKIKTSRLNQLKARLKIIRHAVYKHSFISPFLSLPAVQELIRNISYFKTHTNDIEINQVCDKLLIQLKIISKQLKKGTTSFQSEHIDKVDSQNSSQETFYEPPQFDINLNDVKTSELSDIHSSGVQEMVIPCKQNSQETVSIIKSKIVYYYMEWSIVSCTYFILFEYFYEIQCVFIAEIQ